MNTVSLSLLPRLAFDRCVSLNHGGKEQDYDKGEGDRDNQ